MLLMLICILTLCVSTLRADNNNNQSNAGNTKQGNKVLLWSSANIANRSAHSPSFVLLPTGHSGTNGKTNTTNKINSILSSGEKLPEVYALNQAYPNPFNPSTVISYALPADSYVTVKVYNTLGQEVATLVDELQNAGIKSITFNAGSLSSGIYFYRMSAQAQTKTFTDLKKMLLIK